MQTEVAVSVQRPLSVIPAVVEPETNGNRIVDLGDESVPKDHHAAAYTGAQPRALADSRGRGCKQDVRFDLGAIPDGRAGGGR